MVYRFHLLAFAIVMLSTPLAAATADRSVLRSPATFADVKPANLRSREIFAEMGRVIQHPRCLNCHPATRTPTQGNAMIAHLPVVSAGPDGRGVPGLPCRTCHQDANMPVVGERLLSIPGNPKWALAPRAFAWQQRSLTQICRQLKDPRRNGHRTLARLYRHMAQDALVGWAWRPGAGREPAPGSQAAFGALVKAWIDTGAACPN